MTRTQIYLSDPDIRALDRIAKRTGRTRSQLIREAIERTYLAAPMQEQALRDLRASAGAWGRGEDGGKYVERARSGRLARLHGHT